MKLGPRYLNRKLSFAEPALERVALMKSLADAPGLLAIGGIERHHKGGHRVSLDVDYARLSDFMAYMDSQGWLDGM
ncbi:hypothetical protein J2W86_004311 [Delftia lacustris]|jgi:hypothetical protein|nr:hypothetical protein [Delftia lacustris]